MMRPEIGDHKQLRPVVKHPENSVNNLNISLFERLNDTGNCLLTKLREQHRMPSAIAAFPSKQYYGDSLVSRQQSPESLPAGFDWPSSDPIAFVNVYDEIGHEKGPGEDSTSISNMTEASLVADIVAHFHTYGGKPKLSISVVTFYSSQVQAIESQLRAKRADGAVSWVKTAESAQGLKDDIIIVSLVRSNSYGTLAFVKDFHYASA